jgi:hypothetical protein
MRKILFFVILSISLYFSKAQNVTTATIAWTSNQTTDIKLGDSKDETTVLTTYGSDRIEWKNQNGSLRKSFRVLEIIGEWINVENDGSIQFKVTDMTNAGTITIRKEGGITKIIISLATDASQVTELTIQSSQTF